MKRSAIAYAATILGCTLPASAQVRVVDRFDPVASEHAENVVLAENGTIYVSLLTGRLHIRDPDGATRRLQVGGPHASLTGLAVDKDGGILIGVDRRGGTGPKGVWHLDAISREAKQILRLPSTVMVNGVEIDRTGAIYVADSHGSIWRAKQAGATPIRWLTGAAIAPHPRQAAVNGQPGPTLNVGPNGLKIHGNTLYVSVSGQAKIVAVSLGVRPGRVKTVMRGIFVDDFVFDRDGRLVLTADSTQILATGVERIEKSGTRTTLIGPSDRLQQPSAVAINPGNGDLLITTLGLFGDEKKPALYILPVSKESDRTRRK